MPRLYLLPSTMSDAPAADVIPELNVRVASGLRYFIVENIRTARRFLRRCDREIDIDSLTFGVLNVNTRPDEVAALLAPMEQGHDMGVISEAGCPAVADPGADVVAIAQRRGYEVVPLVGPSSIIMSLMGSGFNGQRFAFCGYLPIEAAERRAALVRMTRRVHQEGETQIFIETPYRNNRLVADLASTLPPEMKLCVASDLTGPRQSIVTHPLKAWRTAKYDYAKIPTIFLLGR